MTTTGWILIFAASAAAIFTLGAIIILLDGIPGSWPYVAVGLAVTGGTFSIVWKMSNTTMSSS